MSIEDTTTSIRKSFEADYNSVMRYTSWQMPKEFAEEFEDELYQEKVDDECDEYIEYMLICFW